MRALTLLSIVLFACDPGPDLAGPSEPTGADPSELNPSEPNVPRPEPFKAPSQDLHECEPTLQGEDFSSIRRAGLPLGTLQVVVWYDGAFVEGETPRLHIEYVDVDAEPRWLTIGGEADEAGPILSFGKGINTRQYGFGRCRLTGRFKVDGVVPNGVIDGVAFGLMARYEDGTYRLVKSLSPTPTAAPDFVGAWPLGMNDATFLERTPQLSAGPAREQGRMMLWGAQHLSDGVYELPVP